MHGGAYGDPWVSVGAAGRLQELVCRVDRVGCVVGASESGDEERHSLVTDELVNDPVPAVDDIGRCAIEPRHQLRELFGGHLLGKPGRAAHVGEHEREFDLRAARPLLEGVDAAAADPPVESGGPEPDEAHDIPRRAERRVAELAARIRGDRPGDPAHPGSPADVPAGLAHEHLAPLLFL
jgi:hypothetical protein